jgi:hypothetical protein
MSWVRVRVRGIEVELVVDRSLQCPPFFYKQSNLYMVMNIIEFHGGPGREESNTFYIIFPTPSHWHRIFFIGSIQHTHGPKLCLFKSSSRDLTTLSRLYKVLCALFYR